MARQKTLLTADDLLNMPEDDHRYELLDGVLVKMSPPGNPHGKAQAVVSHFLFAYVRPRNLGEVFGEIGVLLRRNPDRVRAPDVCFIARNRIPEGGLGVGFVEIVPDLIVEIVSPSDRRGNIEQKVREWLDAGARLVWLMRTDTRTIAVLDAQAGTRILAETDILTADSVLPGFSVAVADLFA